MRAPCHCPREKERPPIAAGAHETTDDPTIKGLGFKIPQRSSLHRRSSASEYVIMRDYASLYDSSLARLLLGRCCNLRTVCTAALHDAPLGGRRARPPSRYALPGSPSLPTVSGAGFVCSPDYRHFLGGGEGLPEFPRFAARKTPAKMERKTGKQWSVWCGFFADNVPKTSHPLFLKQNEILV